MPDPRELEAYLMLTALRAASARRLRQLATNCECSSALQQPMRHGLALADSKAIEGARQLTLRQTGWLSAHQARALHVSHAHYPVMLRESPDPPAWLFIQGNLAVLARPCLAIVGSRRATSLSEELAYAIGQAYAQAGGCVVSGLAVGIDTAAHKGALQTAGATAAVFGCGLHRCYPYQNTALAKQIVSAGVCLSEYPPMTGANRHRFPERNRIIAGLCEGVVVVEAAMKSGSLITARLAMEAGREVFAVPGNIWDGSHQGCHRLLKQGATLVQDIQDIIEELPSLNARSDRVKPAPHAFQQPATQSFSAFESSVLAALSHQTSSIESLVIACQSSVPEVAAALAELEITGVIARQASGYRLKATQQADS